MVSSMNKKMQLCISKSWNHITFKMRFLWRMCSVETNVFFWPQMPSLWSLSEARALMMAWVTRIIHLSRQKNGYARVFEGLSTPIPRVHVWHSGGHWRLFTASSGLKTLTEALASLVIREKYNSRKMP